MTEEQACSCGHDAPPRGMSRRSLLRGAAIAAAAGVAASTVSTRVAFAGSGAYTGDVLVVVSLRGGFDGLSAIVPAGDPYYHTARPSIGVPTSQLHRVDTMFGLHPALAPIFPLWTAGKLAAVHAVGQINPTRSHFAAMQEMERAAPGSTVRTGWLDRTVCLRSAGTPFETVQLGSAVPSTALAGPAPVLAMSELDKLDLIGFDDTTRPGFRSAMETFYAGADSALSAAATDAFATAAAGTSLLGTYQPANGAVYPTGGHSLGPGLRDVARLVKGGVGMQAASIDYGDWDMHAGLGSATSGHWMYDHLRDFALSVAAFATDLGPAMSRVTLVTLSEFGRRVAQNASGGLDHGHGNAVLVMGGGVNGGRVYGRWPGLAPSHLVAGDLPGTTDYRTILGEILQRRCQLGSLSSVFPNFSYAPLGIVRQA